MAKDTCVYFSVVMSHLNFKFFTQHFMLNFQTNADIKAMMDMKNNILINSTLCDFVNGFCTSKGSKNFNNPLQFIIT